MEPRVVLLFCHGGSLHKGVWTPIIRRLRASPLLERAHCDYVAIDWRYHGDNACDDEPATLYYESNNHHKPRVDHPARHWPQWAAEQLVETIKTLQRQDPATTFVGIGHSMGAATLLQVEVLYPGTFQGLVLFEPTLSFEYRIYGGARWAMSMLVKATLARADQWDTIEDAKAYIKSARVYSRWHPESLEAFIEGALKPTKDGMGLRLATPLLHEAALYSHEITNYTREQVARVACPVVFEYGSLTNIFNIFGARALVDACPQTFTLALPLDNVSHQTVMDAPDRCTERILQDLKSFPVFAARASRL